MTEYRKDENLKVSELVKRNKELVSACEEALAYIEKRTEGVVISAKDTLRLALKLPLK
jgi:hypothetical protein